MSEFILTNGHILHGTEYTIQGKRLSSVCILCLTDRLTECQQYSPGQGYQQLQHLTVFIKTVLGDINDLLNEQSVPIVRLIHSSDNTVQENLCSALVDIVPLYQTDIQQLITSVLVSICKLCSEDLQQIVSGKIIHRISFVHNFSVTNGLLSLLGQLLYFNPFLSQYMIQAHGAVLWYFLEGLSHSDESIVSLIVYVFVQLCSSECSLPINIVTELTNYVSTSLTNSRLNDLTVNLMGLVQGLVRVPIYCQCLLKEGSSIEFGLKRVLLTNDDALRLSAVQCIQTISNTMYIKGLASNDLPVYLFEILSSDNDELVSAVLECLVCISNTFMELFTSVQTVFMYDALFNAVEKALTVKNITAVQSGILFLINLLNRPLLLVNFSGATVYRILNIISDCLQYNDLVNLSAITFGKLTNKNTVPSEVKLTDFLSLLSSLIPHFPSLPLPNDPSATRSATTDDHYNDRVTVDILSILLICRNIASLCYERLHSETNGSEELINENDIDEVFGFIMKVTEMKLIPLTLIQISNENQPSDDSSEPLEILLDLLTTLFSVNKDYSTSLAILLVRASFIQLLMEYKAKYERLYKFEAIANNFMEELCYHLVLWDTGDIEEADHTRQMIQISFTNIKCNHGNSLQLLLQRISPHVNDCHSACQRTVLFLFYYLERNHLEPTVSPELLFNTLNGYLSLNPEPHLLPSYSMKHLLALYISCSVISTEEYQMINNTTGEEILIQSLLKLPNPSLVFSSNILVIVWAYERPSLRNIARQWITQWLECPEAIETSDELFRSISSVHHSHLLEDIMNVAINSSEGHDAAVNMINKFALQEESGITDYVIGRVENALQLMNTNVHLELVFSVMAAFPCFNTIRIFNQVVHHLSSWCCQPILSDNHTVLMHGLEICSKGLGRESLIRVQVSNLLINDKVIISHSLSVIAATTNHQVRLTLICLQVIELLIEISYTVRLVFVYLFVLVSPHTIIHTMG